MGGDRGKTESIKNWQDLKAAMPVKCIIKVSNFPVYFTGSPLPPLFFPPRLRCGQDSSRQSLEARSSVPSFYINAAGQRAKASSNWALDNNQALRRLWSCLVHTLQVASCLPAEISLAVHTSTLFLGFYCRKRKPWTHTHTPSPAFLLRERPFASKSSASFQNRFLNLEVFSVLLQKD